MSQPSAAGKWCPWCQVWAVRGCTDWGHAPGWYVPQVPQKPRSVVGTTLLVLLTIFVIAPFLVFVLLNALAAFGVLVG